MGWAEPRSLRQRYGAILDGLTHSQRKNLLADLAKGMAHPVIPEEERHHLYVPPYTMVTGARRDQVSGR